MRSILDGLGLAIAGSRSVAAGIARREVESYGALVPEAVVLGTEMRHRPGFAAFLNGLSIHADDYDDTQLAVGKDRVYGLLTHPTAPVLPVALALAEREDRSGADTLVAYLVGVEVETKVSEAIDPRHYDEGLPLDGHGRSHRSRSRSRPARSGSTLPTTAVALASRPARRRGCARTSAR